MSVAPMPMDDRKISRKLTVNTNQTQINIRPIIKGAIKEGAQTLKEAYLQNSIFEWCGFKVDKEKQSRFLYTLFKQVINKASLQSRDFAVQAEGCKGIMVWTTNTQGHPWPYLLGTAKLARLIGWPAALKATLRLQPAIDKMRRKAISKYERCLTIGYIGVLPQEQRKGLGSALLQYALERADISHYAVLAEITDQRAIPFFETHGFKIEEKTYINKRQDLPVILMVRTPIKSGEPQPLHIRPGRRDSNYLL
ncbi:hypothetical protein CLU79DRAFT_731931 [Phycomyces nitens]|nr:hypothetical protein CLU79DRAFT_731931 [Phycomyces nitens]